MEIIEYPKALYRDGVYHQVDGAEQEAEARADGYDDWQADKDRAEAGAGTHEEADEQAPARKPRATKA